MQVLSAQALEFHRVQEAAGVKASSPEDNIGFVLGDFAGRSLRFDAFRGDFEDLVAGHEVDVGSAKGAEPSASFENNTLGVNGVLGLAFLDELGLGGWDNKQRKGSDCTEKATIQSTLKLTHCSLHLLPNSVSDNLVQTTTALARWVFPSFLDFNGRQQSV